MKIAILIPTIAGRERFLNNALNLISEQTVQPDIIEIINDDIKYTIPDTAWRYKIGIERCKNKGADIIFFWEDDDWYHYKYISIMMSQWTLLGQPIMLGIENTIYYHIIDGRYRFIDHTGRSSMMSTVVTKDFVPFWEDDRNPYVDMDIWRQKIRKGLFGMYRNTPIVVGIKHGLTKVAGGCHVDTNRKLPLIDNNFKYLKSIVDADSFAFYKDLRDGKY